VPTAGCASSSSGDKGNGEAARRGERVRKLGMGDVNAVFAYRIQVKV
jgi:hypothetical protein